MQKELIIIRGLPGSGKSTLANEILHAKGIFEKYEGIPKTLVEADDFRSFHGQYVYDEKLNSVAHSWCLSESIRRLQYFEIVVVANVFHKREHIFPYLELAKTMGAKVTLITLEDPSRKSLEHSVTLGERNTHEVPSDSIERMHEGWEDITQEEIDILIR